MLTGFYPKKGDRVVIDTYEDYQKLPANKKYLMPLIQTNNRLYIRWGTIFFTCLKEFKADGSIIHKCYYFRTIKIQPNYLPQLRRKFKSFSLTWFDEWKNIEHNKYYQWPEYHLGGFLRNGTSLYTKWVLPISNANIFQTDINRNLADLGGIQKAEKELDKNVLELKKLVQKIGDLSKIKFKQKIFLYDESNYINHTFYTEHNKKL